MVELKDVSIRINKKDLAFLFKVKAQLAESGKFGFILNDFFNDAMKEFLDKYYDKAINGEIKLPFDKKKEKEDDDRYQSVKIPKELRAKLQELSAKTEIPVVYLGKMAIREKVQKLKEQVQQLTSSPP